MTTVDGVEVPPVLQFDCLEIAAAAALVLATALELWRKSQVVVDWPTSPGDLAALADAKEALDRHHAAGAAYAQAVLHGSRLGQHGTAEWCEEGQP